MNAWIALLHCSSDSQNPPKRATDHISQISHKLHDRLHHSGKELGFPCGLVKDSVGVIEFIDHVLFFIKGLYDIMSAVYSSTCPLTFAQVFLLCRKYFCEFFMTKLMIAMETAE